MENKDKVCLALDIIGKNDVMDIVEELHDLVGYYKIHFSFLFHGAEVIDEIHDRGGKVFLDLKFHDIPNTVKNYARIATRMGVDMFNVHASGGLEMMKAAVEGATDEAHKRGLNKPKIIGVTVLTSMDQDSLSEIGIKTELKEQVLSLALLAEKARLDGIVCSGHDLDRIRPVLSDDFLYVTPGIKGVSTPGGADQKRIMTPRNAIDAGSSLLVIGRAIYKAEDRRKAAQEILDSLGT